MNLKKDAGGGGASGTRRTAAIGISWLLVLLSALYFVGRVAVWTSDEPLTDVAAPYVSTRLWLKGVNPYDSHRFLPEWFASGEPRLDLPDEVSGAHSVYPPTAFPLFAPFARLNWSAIVGLFLGVGGFLYGLAVVGLIRTGWPGASWREFATNPRAVLFLAFSLGFAPMHTALRSRNVVLIAASLAILSIVWLLGRRDEEGGGWLAGVAIAFSICLKPTTGIFALPWLARDRRVRVLAWAIGVCAVLSVAGLLPMILAHGMAWLPSYRANVTALFTHGGNASIFPENVVRTDRIDLQLALYALTGNKGFSSLLPAVVYVGLLAAFLWNAGWGNAGPGRSVIERSGENVHLDLLVASGSLALGLLPVYSRVYSAIVLLPLVLWCFRELHLKSARWLLFLLSDFLLNTSAIVRRPARLEAIAARHQNLWDGTIGGHTCWLLLLIGVLLVWAAREQRSVLRTDTAFAIPEQALRT